MTTKQPLWDIRYIRDTGMIFTPGRRTPEEFVAACLKHNDGYEVQPNRVKHCYARWIPVWEHGEFVGHYLDYPVSQKRGAFLITIADCIELEEPVE